MASDKAGIDFANILLAKISKCKGYHSAAKYSRRRVALVEFEKLLAKTLEELRSYHEDSANKLEENPDAKATLFDKSFMATYYK